MKQFDSNKFYNSFNITIKALAESERITKDALRSLSRGCLMLIHYESKNQGDISPVNKILQVLTPINRKTFVLFMQEFSGFHYDEDKVEFTNKNKTKEKGKDITMYDVKCAWACESLDDPHFNLWSWADKNIKVEKKAFKLDTLKKDVKRAMEAKDEQDNLIYSKADIIKAVMDGGLTADALIDILQAMAVVDAQ